jgi:hypothetical protein
MGADASKLYIGRGEIFYTPEGGVERTLGNVTTCEITTTDERKQMFSSVEASSPLLADVLVRRTVEISLTLTEFQTGNVALGAMGEDDGLGTIKGGSQSQLRGLIRMAGDPSFGPVYNFQAWIVTLTPDGPLGWISDEFGEIKLKGKILADSVGHPDNPLYEITYTP